jgi:hypothetical protein
MQAYVLPTRAVEDARHAAIAFVYEMDVLVLPLLIFPLTKTLSIHNVIYGGFGGRKPFIAFSFCSSLFIEILHS